MEPPLTQQPDITDDMLAHAHYYARDAQAQCLDVADMAFPSGHLAPSDQMLSAVGVKLRQLVFGIENKIIAKINAEKTADPVSWNMLLQSGFLKEPALIDFILARVAEERLAAAILDNGDVDIADQLPSRLLSSGDAILAESAQAILAGQSVLRRSPERIYTELPSELLHQAVWRVVAALQILSGTKNKDHVEAAKLMFGNHDESQSLQIAARKIVHFYEAEAGDALLDPQNTGLAIFAAALSAKTGLDQDHIIRLIDGHSSFPLAIILRAVNLDRDAAMAVICLFNGFNLTPFEITSFDQSYAVLDQSKAAEIVADWMNARAPHITFPALDSMPQDRASS